MNKKTIFYGLLAVGGILAYYAWKQNSLSVKQNSTSITSGTFVDDVPVNPKILGVKADGVKEMYLGVKDSVSQIIEPFVQKEKANQLT